MIGTASEPIRGRQPSFGFLEVASKVVLESSFVVMALRAALKADILKDRGFLSIYQQVFLHTLTSIENVHALYGAVRYLVRNRIPGDFVECGVWRGGSSMCMALSLLSTGVADRRILLFDTFEGMTPPTPEDGIPSFPWQTKIFDVPLSTVQNNLRSTEYPPANLSFIKGPVEETLPGAAPEQIALLRLDTDFYESTLWELEHLYPRLVPGGILLIDDYALAGARRAVDEYFERNQIHAYKHRIDFSARLVVKPRQE